MAEKLRNGYWVVSDAITEADTNTTKAVLTVPAKTFVSKVSLIVTEVFAGGTPSIDVGDGTNDDGWIDTTDVTETTAGTYAGDGGDAVWALGGKYYSAADTIDAVISASLSNGTAYVVAHFLPLNNSEVS